MATIGAVRLTARGCSSVGRAPALQAGGQRFDPAQLHHSRLAVERKQSQVSEGCLRLSLQAGGFSVDVEPWTVMFKPPQGVKRLEQ